MLYCHKGNTFQFTLCICLTSIFLSCSSDKSVQQSAVLSSIHATSLSNYNDQIIIAGTARDSISQIKSPFIMVYDRSLAKLSQHFFKTKTTALNPQLTQMSGDGFLLSYFRAESPSNQTEISEIHYLDGEFNTDKIVSYGNRTRVKELLINQDDSVLTLNYERATQDISLQFFLKAKPHQKLSFKVSDETNIPTALIPLYPTGFAFSGIAHGFHYPDGHDYKHPKTYAYVISTDSLGQKVHQYNHHGDGHVFINDLIQRGESLFALGTHQSTQSGMDMLLLVLDPHLNLKSDLVFPEAGIQEGFLIKAHKDSFFIAGTTENSLDHKTKSQIQCLDAQYNVKWKTTIEEEGSWKPQDFIILDDELMLLSESKDKRMAPSQSHIHTYSLNGKFLNKKKIN